MNIQNILDLIFYLAVLAYIAPTDKTIALFRIIRKALKEILKLFRGFG